MTNEKLIEKFLKNSTDQKMTLVDQLVFNNDHRICQHLRMYLVLLNTQKEVNLLLKDKESLYFYQKIATYFYNRGLEDFSARVADATLVTEEKF